MVGDNDYKKLKSKLNNHFSPKKKTSTMSDSHLTSKNKSQEEHSKEPMS